MQNDDTQPATKGDLRLLKDDLSAFATKEDLHSLELTMKGDIQRMRIDFLRLEQENALGMQNLSYDIRTLNEAVDRVLTVVVNVDKNLKEQIKDHGNRIVTLERKVG